MRAGVVSIQRRRRHVEGAVAGLGWRSHDIEQKRCGLIENEMSQRSQCSKMAEEQAHDGQNYRPGLVGLVENRVSE
jgi:hypothetical protein